MKKAVSIIIASIMILSVLAFSGVFSAYHYLGDVNADGAVDNKDVVALFRFVSKSASNAIEENCDVNADGSIDNKDVTVLFRSTSNNGSASGKDEWLVRDYVDGEGNKTGVHYIINANKGVYKNETTSEGLLYGAVMIDKQGDYLYMMVLLFKENTQNKIVNNKSNVDNFSIRVQTSAGMALETTGIMYVASDRIFIDREVVPTLLYEFEHGKSLTFTVKPDTDPDKVYEFTVNSSNYRALIPEVDI